MQSQRQSILGLRLKQRIHLHRRRPLWPTLLSERPTRKWGLSEAATKEAGILVVVVVVVAVVDVD